MAWDYQQHASQEAQDGIAFSCWGRTPTQAMVKDQLGGRGCLGTISEEENGALDEAAPLAVEVSIWFVEPAVHSNYRRTYTSSLNFAPSNKICHGLLRRIEHCTNELITRKDSEALQKFMPGKFLLKPLRFGLTFKIRRRGVEEYTQRSFASYQKHPLTADDAKDIVLSTDRTVGLFLKHHDKEFKWLGGSIKDMPRMKPTNAPLSLHGPVSADCVPPAIFNADLQSFEARPGYFLELSLASSNPRRETPRFKNAIRVYSQQTAPLTLFDGEDIFDRGLDAVRRALLLRKSTFGDHLRSCAAVGCLHYHEHAVNIQLRVVNNLAPRHDHLHQTLRSKLVLFRDPDAHDCLQFLTEIERHLHNARDLVDAKISRMNDFEFRIVQLQGVDWSTNNVTPICLGSEASYSRRTIEAALSRIQTGIGDVIRSQDIAIHFAAYKRGHLLVDKALVARRKSGRTKERFGSAEEEKSTFLSRLRIRIQKDLDLVCKDTCSLDELADDDQDEASLEVRQESEEIAEELPRYTSEISASGDEELLQARQRQESENQLVHDGPIQNLSSRYPDSIATILAEDDFEDRTRASYLSGVSIDLTTPGETVQSTLVQRAFPLVPSSYSPSTRVDSGSILVNGIPDAETRVSTEDDLEDQIYSSISRGVQMIESASAGHAKLEQPQVAELPTIPERAKDDEDTKHALMQSQEGDNTDAKAESTRNTCTTEIIGAGDDEITPIDGPEQEPPHEEVAPMKPRNGVDHAPDDPTEEHTGPRSPWNPSTLLDSTNPQLVVSVDIQMPMDPMDDFSRTRMDILETVGYDEEPDVSVDSIEMSKCETRNSIGSIESDEEGPSTVPSTPGRSEGTESPPRQGLLKGPISSRCLPALRDSFGPEMGPFYSPENTRSGPDSDVGTVALGDISKESETVDWYEPRNVLAGLQPIPVPENAEESSTTSSLTITVPEDGFTELSYSRIEPESPILLFSDARVGTQLENAEPREPLVSAHMQAGSHSTQSRISGSDRIVPEVPEPANLKGLEGVLNIPVPELTAEPWPDSESASTPGPETPILPVLSESENKSDVFEQLEIEAHPKLLGSIGLNFSREDPNPLSAGHPVAVSCEPKHGVVEPTSTMSATQILVPALEPALAEVPSHASVPLGPASLGEDSESPVVKHIKGDAPLSPEGMHASRNQAYLAYLAPARGISTKSSRSTLAQVSGTDASQPGGRGSVEDVIALESEETSPSDSGYTYRPQTAGYLGLHETRLVEVGLRGALGGARRHSLPLQQLPRASTPIESVPLSPGLAKQKRPRRDRKQRPKSTGTIGPAEQSDKDRVLPRVMMLFAGMAVASRFLGKQP